MFRLLPLLVEAQDFPSPSPPSRPPPPMIPVRGLRRVIPDYPNLGKSGPSLLIEYKMRNVYTSDTEGIRRARRFLKGNARRRIPHNCIVSPPPE